jgi:hypothetical protein
LKNKNNVEVARICLMLISFTPGSDFIDKNGITFKEKDYSLPLMAKLGQNAGV